MTDVLSSAHHDDILSTLKNRLTMKNINKITAIVMPVSLKLK